MPLTSLSLFTLSAPHPPQQGIGPRVMWISIGGSIFFGVLERAHILLGQL